MDKKELKNQDLEKVQGGLKEQDIQKNDRILEIADREFIVLDGPEGCGKSTSLR